MLTGPTGARTDISMSPSSATLEGDVQYFLGFGLINPKSVLP